MGRKKNKKNNAGGYYEGEEEIASDSGSEDNQQKAKKAEPLPEIRILTKAEKAKLKKQRELEAKKEAARKKRAAADAAAAKQNGGADAASTNSKQTAAKGSEAAAPAATNNKQQQQQQQQKQQPNNNKNDKSQQQQQQQKQNNNQKQQQKTETVEPKKTNNNNNTNNNNKNNNNKNNKKKGKQSAAQRREQERLAQVRARLLLSQQQGNTPAAQSNNNNNNNNDAPKAAAAGKKKGTDKEEAEAADLAQALEAKKAAEAARAKASADAAAKVEAKHKAALDELADVALESSDDEAALGVAGIDTLPAQGGTAADDDDDDDDDVKDAWDASSSDEDETPDDNNAEQDAAAKAEAKAARKAKRAQKRALLAKIEKEKRQAIQAALAALEPDSDSEEEEEEEGALRSPICCVLGHVDTGKTKLLDRIRRTDVQGGEAGGITQQIGATYFPMETLKTQTSRLTATKKPFEIKVPGLLVIDTPGHESFTNLRSRGSSLCDIAILVVDLMHGLEPQTIESIQLLRKRKTPFVVAVNKVDRCVDWKPTDGAPVRQSLKKQSRVTMQDFEQRVAFIQTQFAENELNVELYWKNKDYRTYVSLVPTSAITGEGVPDILMLMIQLMQKMMAGKLTKSLSLNCTILEVKQIEGFGTTIDVILVDGVLREGDTIVVCGMSGAIVTTVRALLTPHPGKELRVKGAYMHHKKIRGAMGVKIAAHELDGAVAGSSLLVAARDDDIEALETEVMRDMTSVLNRVDKSGRGVTVQASTLGSLEALLEFLRVSKIPVAAIGIGPVHRREVMRASIMLEHETEFATILAFDVKVTEEAKKEAASLGVNIFSAKIIYHLFDQFTEFMQKIKKEREEAAKEVVVWPVVLKIMPEHVFNIKNPIVLGCEVQEGTLRIGTPICVPGKGAISLGRVTSIERDHKAVDRAPVGDQVAVKIQATTQDEQQRTYGRQFNGEDLLMSKISRGSIDALKKHFASDVTREDKILIQKLKKTFGIQ